MNCASSKPNEVGGLEPSRVALLLPPEGFPDLRPSLWQARPPPMATDATASAASERDLARMQHIHNIDDRACRISVDTQHFLQNKSSSISLHLRIILQTQ
jgi:hypothetical protein